MSNVDNNSVNNVSASGEGSRLELYVNQDWKDVEVNGVSRKIPTEWRCSRIEDLCHSIGSGRTPQKSGYVQVGTPWLTISDISGGRINYERAKKIDNSILGLREAVPGDVLFSIYGSIGETHKVDRVCTTNQAILILKVKENADFLVHSLRYNVHDMKASEVRHGVQANLSLGIVSGYQLVWPEEQEQSLIAQALSTQEAQVADLRKLAALERQRLTWLSDELLSGRLRVVEDPTAEPVVVSRDENGEPVEVLPGVRLVENDVFISCVINGKKSFIPDGWQNKKIRDIVDRRKEKTNSSHNYVGLENITQNTGAYIESSGAKVVEGSTSSVFQRGDLLYGKLRPYLKKVWLADFSGTCSTEFLVLSPKCNPFFLKAHLLGEDVTDIACGTSEGTRMPRTDWHTIGNIDIMCPPPNEQSLIAAVLTAQEKQAADIERLADLEQKRLEWLSDELLSGRLRIKVPA